MPSAAQDKAERVPKKIRESLGVMSDQDAAVVQTKDARIRCPACGDGAINVQANDATCLHCGHSAETMDFVEPHVVYIKVVPDDDFSLSRKDMRYKTRCPSCNSRDVTFLFAKVMCRCNRCANEGPVLAFYAEKAHPHPGADDGDL